MDLVQRIFGVVATQSHELEGSKTATADDALTGDHTYSNPNLRSGELDCVGADENLHEQGSLSKFPLLDLPIDVIRLVFEELEFERKTLRNLTLVSSHVNALVTPILYWHIEEIRTTEQWDALRLVFDERPLLKSHVRYCRPIHIDEFGRPDAESWDEFPNLQRIVFERETWCDDMTSHEPLSTERLSGIPKVSLIVGQFPKIRSVQLDTEGQDLDRNADFGATDIVHLLLGLPRLKHLRANQLSCIGVPLIPESLPEARSNVTVLELFGSAYWNCTPENFRTILSLCPRLEKLRCFIPTPTVISLGLASLAQDHFVSPTKLEWMLEPVKGTLKHLTMFDWRYDAKYDHSVMDFSSFPVLEELIISGCCVLPPWSSARARESLYQRLPKTLRVLKLPFPRASGVFYYYEPFEKAPVRESKAIPPERTAWLEQFITRKESHFPDLTTIRLFDPKGYSHDLSWSHTDWADEIEMREYLDGYARRSPSSPTYPHGFLGSSVHPYVAFADVGIDLRVTLTIADSPRRGPHRPVKSCQRGDPIFESWECPTQEVSHVLQDEKTWYGMDYVGMWDELECKGDDIDAIF